MSPSDYDLTITAWRLTMGGNGIIILAAIGIWMALGYFRKL